MCTSHPLSSEVLVFELVLLFNWIFTIKSENYHLKQSLPPCKDLANSECDCDSQSLESHLLWDELIQSVTFQWENLFKKQPEYNSLLQNGWLVFELLFAYLLVWPVVACGIYSFQDGLYNVSHILSAVLFKLWICFTVLMTARVPSGFSGSIVSFYLWKHVWYKYLLAFWWKWRFRDAKCLRLN